jgi:hypothetical protein
MATQTEKPVEKKTSLLSQGLIVFSWMLLFFFLGSYLITESWTWGYRGKWTNIHTYIPASISHFHDYNA